MKINNWLKPVIDIKVEQIFAMNLKLLQVKTIQLIQTTPEDLAKLISSELENRLQSISARETISDNNELLTRQEACDFLKIDSSTLWHWTNKGKVKAYGIANRRYYKKSELLDCLKPLKK